MNESDVPRYICGNCGAEVWWSFPRPEDPCYECGKPIGIKSPVNVNDTARSLRIAWPEPARTLRYWISFKVKNENERNYLLGKLDELMETKADA